MNIKGQSTVEYILLVTAVLAVIIALTTGSNSVFQRKLTNSATITMTGMETEAAKLTNLINQP